MPRLRTLTVRQRISLAVAALVSSALIVTGVTVYVVESRRIDAAIETTIANELAGFRKFAPDQPVTARLTSYLESSFPPAGSAMWAFNADGTVTFVGPDAKALRTAQTFPKEVRQRLETGGVFDFVAEGQAYRVGVLPVHHGTERSALVATMNTNTARAELRELMITFALLAALSIMIVVALSNLVARRALSPLRQLRDTARTVTEGSLSDRIEVTGRDDLADLQRTFNDMLDRLESSMSAQKGMLDDAAHELRTPLTIIRGHIELLDVNDPADVEATRSIVTDEIDRMGRLVSDLLILAKTDRHDFVRTEPTYVASAIDSVLARVAPLAERDWRTDSALNEIVLLDEQRIVQALVQLVDNAIKHTSEGDVIAIGASRNGPTLEIWVRDTGRGIDPAQRELIFERFQQADPESDGFGLELTIVSAIAKAHGGTLALDEHVPGVDGATFRIRITQKEDS